MESAHAAEKADVQGHRPFLPQLGGEEKSVVFHIQAEISLGMIADRTLLRSVGAKMNVAAVQADPAHFLTLGKDRGLFHVFQQGQVTLLMVLLDLAHCLKQIGNLLKAFSWLPWQKVAHISVHS